MPFGSNPYLPVKDIVRSVNNTLTVGVHITEGRGMTSISAEVVLDKSEWPRVYEPMGVSILLEGITWA